MIATGESGDRVVILSQEDDAAPLVRLAMTDEQAVAMMAQLTVLLEARAARRGEAPALRAVLGELDPAEESRAADAAELARREREAKQEAAREARRARVQGGTT